MKTNIRHFKINQNVSGFTLIELILATAIFSFFLIIALAGYLNVVRLYQNGIASRSTQHNSRFGMEEMVRAVQGAKTATVPSAGTLCLDGSTYFYTTGAGVLTEVVGGGCSSGGSSQVALSSSDVNVASLAFSIDNSSPTIAHPTVNITMVIQQGPTSGISPFASSTTLTSAATLRGN